MEAAVFIPSVRKRWVVHYGESSVTRNAPYQPKDNLRGKPPANLASLSIQNFQREEPVAWVPPAILDWLALQILGIRCCGYSSFFMQLSHGKRMLYIFEL